MNGIPSCKGAREQRDIEKKVGSWSGTVLLLTVIMGACPLDLNLDLVLHSVYEVPKQIECKGFQT